VAGGFGSGSSGIEAAPAVDLKVLHAKIGELTLENDPDQVGDKLFGRCARQSRPAERKAMIDREHNLPLARQAELLRLSRSTLYVNQR
jgi:putative transposase